MLNVPKIKGRMAELGIKQKDLARVTGASPCTISQKLNGRRPLTLDEAEAWAVALKIGDQQFGKYFFAKKIA
jgi:transcriptional regulator with XRE-family HTH domain